MEVLAEHIPYDQQRAIYDELASTTTAHIDRNAGLFEKLDFDPVRNPSQDLRTVHMPAVPTTPEELDALATAADERLYPYIKDAFIRQETLMGLLRRKRSEMHIFPVTTHQKMPDVAVEQAAATYAEHELFETPWHEIISTNGLIISRGVSTLQAFSMAASEVVQKEGNTFLSFPRTDTMRKVIDKIHLPGDIKFDNLVDDNNKRMRREVLDWLPAGFGHLPDMMTIHPLPKKRLFMAWEGTTAEVTGDDRYNPERVELEQASYAIISVLKHGAVLPSVIWDRGPEKEPIFITGDLMPVKHESHVDRVQEWQRSRLARALGLPDENVTIKKKSVNTTR